MKSELLLEITQKEAVAPVTEKEGEDIQELISLIEEMNIVDFEPMLDENLNSEISESFPGKYQILAILRDLFEEYKAGGDSELQIELGTCGHNCDRKCPVINLRGNNSGKNFAFGLDKMDSNVVNFHTCYGFVDNNKSPKFIDGDMMINSLKKGAEMKGQDTSRYNDRMKTILMEAVHVFHEK